MAALAPLGGATTAVGPALAPIRPSPAAAPSTGHDNTGTGTTFTAFPTSYRSFGNGEAGYGTVGVKNGALTVVSVPSAAPAPSQAPAASKPDPTTGSGVSTGSSKPSDPPPGDPEPPPPPVATLPPQPIAQTPGLQVPSLAGPFPAPSDEPAGLPGPFADVDQAPDPLQQDQAAQQAAAQAQQQQQNSTAETQTQLLTASLQDVTFHISAANSAGDGAAAQQLAPLAVQINGALQNQPFAGIGTTPPQPFAPPEIPTVFLNFPA